MSLVFNLPVSPRNLIAEAARKTSAGQAVAMITLINIEGSAPYPIGSQMLVDETGDFVGQITGGCAETALADQAMNAMQSGDNVTQRYGLNSPFFDIQLPCGSGIDVHVDVNSGADHYQELDTALKRRAIAKHSIETPEGEFLKQYYPNERLILAGQGPILSSLAQLALASGFEVACLVQNADTAERMQSLAIDTLLLSSRQLDFAHDADAYTAVVSLFHEHDYETDILASALRSDAFYIGALGSKRTHAVRCESLLLAGIAENEIVKIHGPVGMNIGAKTPAQIAISVLAEIVNEMNNSAVYR